MTLYELLLFLHVVAAIIWLGAGFVLAVLTFGAQRAGDMEKEAGYHEDVAWLATRLFIPASMAVLLLGFLLIAEGSWSLDQLWIVLGLVGWLASFAVGIGYFKPESERVEALVAEHGARHPEIESRIRRMNVIERVELLVLFMVVADMTIKPTGDDAGTLVAFAAILGAAVVWAGASLRSRPTRPAEPAAETAR